MLICCEVNAACSLCEGTGEDDNTEDVEQADIGLCLEVTSEPVNQECYQRGRKTVRNPDQWKKNIRKRCRARGEEYLSTTGKKVPAKSFVTASCHCPLKSAKKKSPQFVVTRMRTENFVSTKGLQENSVNRKKTQDGDTVQWLKIQWIHFDRDHPNIMFFKTSNNPESLFSTVDLSKKARGRPKSTADIPLPLLYPEGKAIAKAKLIDLKSLLNFVPPIYHSFYRSLKYDTTTVDDEIWTDDEQVTGDVDDNE